MRVDVSGSGRVRFARADAPALPLRAPLVLAPVALQLYADPAPRFGLRSLLANPVYLLLGFGALFAFVLPRWLESMDPDELKKIQEAQSKGGLAAMLGLAPGGGGGTEGEEGKEGGAAPAAAAAAEAAAQPAAGSAVKRVKKAVAAESG